MCVSVCVCPMLYVYMCVCVCMCVCVYKFNLSLIHTAYLLTWCRNPNTQLANLTWKCTSLVQGWEIRKNYFDKLSWIYKVSLTLSQALLYLLAFFFFF